MNGIVDWFTALEVTEIIIVFLVFVLLALLLEAFFLYLALKITDARNTDFKDAFISALLMALVGWIPILGCILQWVIISKRHETGMLKAIGIWLLAGLLPIIIALSIIILVLFPIMAISVPAIV